MNYVGIDFHKNYSFITEMDETGAIQRQLKLSNNRHTLKGYLERLPVQTKTPLRQPAIGIIFMNLLKSTILMFFSLIL